MATAIDAINKVLLVEKGFVNNPADKGGPTNFGITQKVYEQFVGRKVTIDEIKNMPKGNAVTIYKSKYWDAVKGDSIKDYGVAYAIFDQAVNRGPVVSVKRVQRVLGLSQDGIMGPQTLSTLNATNPKTFLENYLNASKIAYNQIVANDPTQSTFIKGWLNRVEEIKNYTSKFIGTPVGKAGIGVGVIALLGIGLYLFLNRKK